jgi:hypothetical protein
MILARVGGNHAMEDRREGAMGIHSSEEACWTNFRSQRNLYGDLNAVDMQECCGDSIRVRNYRRQPCFENVSLTSRSTIDFVVYV